MFNYPDPINPLNACYSTTSSCDVVLVPDLITKAMGRHNLNVIDIREYACIRRLSSLDDLAFWAALNDEAKINTIALGTPFVGQVFEKITPEQTQEWTCSVLPLSRSKEVVQAAREYLSCGLPQASTFYEFKSIGKTTLVVVRRGFMKHLEKTEPRLTFLRELIKAREAATSYHEAADTALFGAFLQLTTSFNG